MTEEIQQRLHKEIELMQQLKEQAIKEWRAYDIPTIDNIIKILNEVAENDGVDN